MRGLLFALFALLAVLPGALSLPYTYTLLDGSGNTISSIESGDVINLQFITEIQIILTDAYTHSSNKLTFTNIYASNNGYFSYTIPGGYKTSNTVNSPPFYVYYQKNKQSSINIRSLYNSYNFYLYYFDAKARYDPQYERFYLIVLPTSDAVCQYTQAGYGGGPVCQNGGTCVGNSIGSSCSCPVNFDGEDCSVCASGFTGPSCSTCLPGHYGPNCLPCPNCGAQGTCNSGLTGNGKCTCSTGWAGEYCTTCATGYSGPGCANCASGFFGPTCTPCPNCGPKGICNSGKSGNGQCSCVTGWTSFGGGVCNACASGYFGSSCTACPNCGPKGTCNDGVPGDTAGTGQCVCAPGWVSANGGNCNACADGFFGPNCTACPSCGSKGSCDQGVAGDTGGSGQCVCFAGWVSANGGRCNACADGFYGPSCTACPNCGAHGSCDQGVAGDTGGSGQCICQAGWVSYGGGRCNACADGFYGPSCTPCPSCGQGTCDDGWPGDIGGTGTCTCQPGWTSFGGGNCNACADGFYGPSCAPCPSCGPQGTCSQGVAGDTGGSGQCICAPGWTSFGGGNCNACASGFYGPSCTPCPSCGQGTCDDGAAGDTGGTGTCTCQPGWVSANGGNCNACAPGFYGPSCTPCPDCGPHGTCDDGAAGDTGGSGQCICALGWASADGGRCNACSSNFAGAGCEACAPGFYGPACTACPACPPHSYCSEGRASNGSCLCEDRWQLGLSGECDTCAPGFTGPDCSDCLEGFFGPSCTPCRDCIHGACISGADSDGSCSCDSPYTLASDGLCTACADGFYGPSCTPCPDCGPHATCDDGAPGDNGGTGQCVCKPGRLSFNGGLCNACRAGFYGPNCTACPACGSHGTCEDSLTGSGQCLCALGWASANGGQCNVCAPSFLGSQCTDCVDGIYPDCFTAQQCPGGCEGHGICNFRTGECTCDQGFTDLNCGSCVLEADPYPACTKGIICPLGCSGHGSCNTNEGTCQCDPGFGGDTCDQCAPGFSFYPECIQLQLCPNNCSSHGTCSFYTGQCTCDPHYAGPACDACDEGYAGPEEGCWQIFECPNNCSDHGACNLRNGTCTCDPSYVDEDCSTRLHCFDNPCQNGGTCAERPENQTHECACPDSYIGENCEILALAPVIDLVAPLVGKRSGENITVMGKDLQVPVRVELLLGTTSVGQVVVNELIQLGRRRASSMSFSFTTPPVDSEGYYTLQFTNPGGQSAQYPGLFLTDLCPEEGQFAQNGTCISCPSHAICPGGGRIFADSGAWTPDSQTPPMACPPPASRCLGGELSACADGYFGELCAFCVDGYAKDPATGACEPCPNGLCREIRMLTPSLFFFLACIFMLLVVIVALAFYRLRRSVNDRKKKKLSKRLSQKVRRVSQKYGKKDIMSEHEISYITEARPSVDRSSIDGEESDESDAEAEPVAPSAETPNWENAGGFMTRSPLFDAEAICLDRTLHAIPHYEPLYSQIVRTARSDLAFARIAQQVTKKILRDHEHDILEADPGYNSVILNEANLQRLIERYLEETGWRVVGSLNAFASRSQPGSRPAPQAPGELPYAVQISEDRGPKPAMENRWFVQLYANELLGLGSNPNISVIGIFDGFAGTEAADYVSQHLHVNLLRNENFKQNPYTAFYEAYMQTNDDFASIVEAERLPDVVGCTSVLCLIRGKELWVSWTGDCQAVMVRANGQALAFCEPHTPENDSEVERVQALGGSFVEKNGHQRLAGIYPITRAFGCLRVAQFITSEPEVVAFDIQGGEKFLVLANGPFWNYVDGDALSSFLSQFKGSQASGIADALVQHARSLGCVDNLTVSVLSFSP